MQTLPMGWEEARSGLYRMETMVTIAGTEYHESNITDLHTGAALFSKNTVSVGGCVAKEIDLTVIPQGNIPRMAEIRVFVRPVVDGIATGWLQKGVYYIDTRQVDYATGQLVIHGYDAMLKAEQIFTDGTDTGNWPRAETQVVEEIAERMGVVIDHRTVMNDSYMVEYPADYTMREILRYIAVTHAGNWTITDTGELRLVPLATLGDYFDVGMEAVSLDTAPAFSPFTGVKLLADSRVFFSGSDAGRVLEAECPWANQIIADDVLRSVQGYVYQPYKADGALLDPASEIGDSVAVAGITGVLASIATTFNKLCASDIEAPSDDEINHEYPYVKSNTRQLDRKIAQNRSLIEKTEERILIEVESQSGDIADLQVTASEIESRVQDAEGQITVLQQDSGNVQVTIVDQKGTLQTTIDADSWEAIRKNLAGETTSGFWFDFEAEQFVFDGTGEFRSRDGNSYITIEGDELVMYSKYGATGEYLDKIHLGFMSGADPSNSGDTIDYPYMLLGKASGDVGMVKKFYNGLWIGNSVPKNVSGNFEGMEGASGFFINTKTGKSYVVNGTDMKDVYAGTTNEVVITSDNVSHDGDLLSAAMPVYLDQAEYDAKVAAGSINPDTPYFIQKEV